MSAKNTLRSIYITSVVHSTSQKLEQIKGVTRLLFIVPEIAANSKNTHRSLITLSVSMPSCIGASVHALSVFISICCSLYAICHSALYWLQCYVLCVCVFVRVRE